MFMILTLSCNREIEEDDEDVNGDIEVASLFRFEEMVQGEMFPLLLADRVANMAVNIEGAQRYESLRDNLMEHSNTFY